MIIGGLQKVSLIDYPGKVAAVIFTRGCNFRCGYCHNPELVRPELYSSAIPEKAVLDFLGSRRGKLEAVVITGGEPTLQPDLLGFLRQLKLLGFLVKLDTNGSRPKVLQAVIENSLADYIALDVKAPWEKYRQVAGTAGPVENIQQSVELVKRSGMEHEFRTTIVGSQLDREDILKIGRQVAGAELYALQKFVPSKAVDPEFLGKTSLTDGDLLSLRAEVKSRVQKCIIR